MRGEISLAELCCREGISQGIYYKWSKAIWVCHLDYMTYPKKYVQKDTSRQIFKILYIINIYFCDNV